MIDDAELARIVNERGEPDSVEDAPDSPDEDAPPPAPATTSGTERAGAKKRAGTLPTLVEIPLLLVVAAVIALIVKTFLAQAFFIPSASMEPQLTAGDRVVVSRTAYRLHDPNRGDVVVFPDPTVSRDSGIGFLPLRLGREALEAVGVVRPGGRELIKRVIGLPGETVSAVDGVVHIDGKPLFEPYLPEGLRTEDFGPTPVPEGHLFMMGDNRGNSKDSRRIGTIEADTVVGRALALVWPPGRMAFL